MKDKSISDSVLQFIVTLAGSLFHAYVLTVLWRWFAVPLQGVSPLSLPAAGGLSLMARFVLVTAGGKAKETTWASTIVGAVILPIAALGAGWIWHQFM